MLQKCVHSQLGMSVYTSVFSNTLVMSQGKRFRLCTSCGRINALPAALNFRFGPVCTHAFICEKFRTELSCMNSIFLVNNISIGTSFLFCFACFCFTLGAFEQTVNVPVEKESDLISTF